MEKGKLDNKINIEENSFPTTKVVGVEAKVKPEIAGIPEQFSKEFINFLLVNALRCLTEEQRHTLTLALVQRDTILMDALKQFSV